MKKIFNSIIIYYMSYYLIINLILQLLFIYSFYTIIFIFENTLLQSNFVHSEEEDRLIKESMDVLVTTFSSNKDYIRYYGMVEIPIGDKTMLLKTQFYIDYISNKEKIYEFLKQVDWQSLILIYSDTNNICKNVLEQYTEHIQMVEKQNNMLLYMQHTIPEIKQTVMLVLNKELLDYNQNYLNNFDWELYLRTSDYQTNNMQTLANIYQDILISNSYYKLFRNILIITAFIYTCNNIYTISLICVKLFNDEGNAKLVQTIYKSLFYKKITEAELILLVVDFFEKFH